MLDARRRGGSRQRALDDVRAALDKKGKLTPALLSYLEGMRGDPPVESWDRLCFELSAIREAGLAAAIARVCRDKRTEAWAKIDGDDGLLSHILPMCAQFGLSSDDSVESIRFKLASMSDTVSDGVRPAERMRAFMANMARFGSMADDRMIRAIAEEVYVRRGHLGRLCDICGDMLRFTGSDRNRLAASTLVEDIIGAVLAELHRMHGRAHAHSTDADIFPLVIYIGEHSPDKLLDRCVDLLARRARLLRLAVPRAPRGRVGIIWASALAHRISVRAQESCPEEIVLHARRHHPRAYRFLGLNRARAASRLEEGGALLAENASTAIARLRLAGVRDALPTGQDALGLLEAMLGCMEGEGTGAGPAVMKKWRSGMLGQRLWGSLLEMEMHLRLRIAGAGVLAVAAPFGHGVAMEADGCRVEAYSPLDGCPPEGGRAGKASPGAEDMFGRARPGGETGRTIVAVDCTMGAPVDLEDTANMLVPALGSGAQPGALCLVRREWGRHEHALLKNPRSAQQIPDSAAGLIARALEIDLFRPKGLVP
ncbi:MAG: hypothetical protein OXU25_03170 [Thaumarchaeota archaeon]|nr:hypothetical protein [Nitrososphaerota archaeon]